MDRKLTFSDFIASDAPEGMRFYVIFEPGATLPVGLIPPTPLALVRQTASSEEAFTRDRLAWAPSDLLSRAPAQGWLVHETEIGYINGFVSTMSSTIRAQRYESELAEYTYFAVFHTGLDVGDLDKAYLLVRMSGRHHEECYAGHGRWAPTDKIYRLGSGRDWHEEHIAVSEAEADHLMRLEDERQAEWWRYHVITADDRPLAVVRVTTHPRIADKEIAFTGESGWGSSDLMRRVPAEPTWTVSEIGQRQAVETMAVLVGQHRRDEAHYAAGYAVFGSLADVLDLDSARRVVSEPGPGDEIAVRISEYERDRLSKRIELRQARRRAEPSGDHLYFAVSDGGGPFSVIRCAAGENGPWEMFLRDGVWLRARKPRSYTTVPIGREDVEEITRAVQAAEPRYFEIRHDERGPWAKVRLGATGEQAVEDLGFTSSDLLSQMPGEPLWHIAEQTAETFTVMRYYGARLDRGVRWREANPAYFAVFPSMADAMDLGRATAVVRVRDGVEEKFVRGSWEPADELSGLLANLSSRPQSLPISQEEADRLIAQR